MSGEVERKTKDMVDDIIGHLPQKYSFTITIVYHDNKLKTRASLAVDNSTDVEPDYELLWSDEVNGCDVDEIAHRLADFVKSLLDIDGLSLPDLTQDDNLL